MKMEKKIATLCIVALIIGMATALPLTYFTPTIGVTAQTDPWFNTNILYANTTTDTFNRNGDTINVVTNFTLTSDAVNLKDADAKIEVFNFHIYSDQISIANITYSLSLTGHVPDPNTSTGSTAAIREYGDDYYVLADGTKYSIKDAIGYAEGIGSKIIIYAIESADVMFIDENGELYRGRGSDVPLGLCIGNVTALLSEDKGERSAQALINLRNAQTLCIDVTRVMTVTYKHQNSVDSTVSSIITILSNSEVLSHIELTKTDSGFTYGDVSDLMQNQPWIGITRDWLTFTSPTVRLSVLSEIIFLAFEKLTISRQ